MGKKTNSQKPNKKSASGSKTNAKAKLLEKGRPIAEQEINPRKVKALVEKGLFYHQHRVTLINLNMKEYQSDPEVQAHQYIGKKIEGRVQYGPLLDLLNDKSNEKVKELKCMIETALTLKNVDIRVCWEQIYFQVIKKILSTSVTEVNSKSKMEAWGSELRKFMKLEYFLQLLKTASEHFPKLRKVEDLIVNESYCFLARYFHFQVNICENPLEEKKGEKEEEKLSMVEEIGGELEESSCSSLSDEI